MLCLRAVWRRARPAGPAGSRRWLASPPPLHRDDRDLELLRRWQDRLSLPPTPQDSRLGEEVAELLHTVVRLRRASPQSAVPDDLCAAFMAHYSRQDAEARRAMLRRMARDFGAPSGDVAAAAARYAAAARRGADDPTAHAAAAALAAAARPLHAHLLAPLGAQPRGLPFLVALRADLEAALREAPAGGGALRALGEALREALAAWFGAGMLDLRRLTWEATPAAVLERVKDAEAVHRMAGWGDLRDRLGPRRRVFALTHAAMPGEPLVVLHAALMTHAPEAMPEIINQPQAHLPPCDPTTAVFYSISNTQPGLARVELGHFLIKKVATELLKEFDLQTLVTLSPLPGFAAWVNHRLLVQARERSGTPEGDLAERLLVHLENDAWLSCHEAEAVVRPWLMRAAAVYLLREKRRGLALDPVAAFHLKNGATCWRLNWRADVSGPGLERSHGIMVNYMYDLGSLEANNRVYVVQGKVAASEEVLRLLDTDEAS
ncbi:hypothetical protein ACKKBG_A16160 [Auxenochlorella protothecoides x Auxenochlorella symbiontica]